MVYCCVPFCKNRHTRGGLSFHKFPLEPALRSKWLSLIPRPGWEPSPTSVVCSSHFREDCYSISTTRRKLLPKTFPTIFKIDPESLKKKKTGKQKCLEDINLEDARDSGFLVCGMVDDFELSGLSNHKEETVNTGERVCGDFQGYEDQDYGSYATVFEDFSDQHKKPELSPEEDKYKDACVGTDSDPPSPPPSTTDVAVQVDSMRKEKLKMDIEATHIIRRKNKTISRLKQKMKELRDVLRHKQKESPLTRQCQRINEAAEQMNNKALFLRDQVLAFGSRNVKYHENILKLCILWQRKFPSAYEFARQMEILYLPREDTLAKLSRYFRTGLKVPTAAELNLESD